MRFLILGRSDGKEEKTKKLEKEAGTSAYPWSLETTRCGYKVNMVAIDVVKIKREQGKLVFMFET